MKLIRFVNAHMALGVLGKIRLPADVAYAIFRLRREIEPKAQFFGAEEMKLAEKYGARRADGKLDIRGGRVVMKGDTDEERARSAEGYSTERDKLCGVEDDDVRCVPLIRLPSDIKIAPEIFEALDGFAVVEVENAE